MVVQLLSPQGIRLMRVPDPPPPVFTLSVPPPPAVLKGTFAAPEPMRIEYRYLGDESYEQCAPAQVG